MFFNLFRKRYHLGNIKIKTILVTEYHRIGDVLLINEALSTIKKAFPESKLILICNESAIDLAKELKIADEVLAIHVPWTNWDWSISKWLSTREFAKNLRRREIDLAFDFKGDLRNSWFLWHTCPKISFGYHTTGGRCFFTHSFKMNYKLHQSNRARKLISKAGFEYSDPQYPDLRFNRNGFVVFHIGSSDKNKSWPMKNWVMLAELLTGKHQIAVVKTPGSAYLKKVLKDKNINVENFEGDLVQFKNWLKTQYCLVGVDSMAGHLAAYVGIPVFTIFGSNESELTRPISRAGEVIKPDKICNHNRNHWRFCQKCLSTISPKKVAEAIFNKLSAL